MVKNPPGNAGDVSLTSGLGRSPGVGNVNPFQYSCLEIFHGQRSLAGYSPWGRKELDTAERLSLHTHNQNFSMLQSEYNLEYKCRLFPLSYYLGLGREARTGRKTYSRYLIASSLETTDMEDVTFLKTAELPEIGI